MISSTMPKTSVTNNLNNRLDTVENVIPNNVGSGNMLATKADIVDTQQWLPAVDTQANLPTVPDATRTWLCRVNSENNVYQWASNDIQWRLFSVNQDFVDMHNPQTVGGRKLFSDGIMINTTNGSGGFEVQDGYIQIHNDAGYAATSIDQYETAINNPNGDHAFYTDTSAISIYNPVYVSQVFSSDSNNTVLSNPEGNPTISASNDSLTVLNPATGNVTMLFDGSTTSLRSPDTSKSLSVNNSGISANGASFGAVGRISGNMGYLDLGTVDGGLTNNGDAILTDVNGQRRLSTTIPNGSDFNDLLSPGKYYTSNATGMINAPEIQGGNLEVLSSVDGTATSTSGVTQKYTSWSNRTYIRVRAGATPVWSSWTTVLTPETQAWKRISYIVPNSGGQQSINLANYQTARVMITLHHGWNNGTASLFDYFVQPNPSQVAEITTSNAGLVGSNVVYSRSAATITITNNNTTNDLSVSLWYLNLV